MDIAKVIALPKGCNDPVAIAETGVKEIHSWWKEMGDGVKESSLRIGHLLIKIKAECKRAGTNFTDLFPKDKSEIGKSGKMPFSYDTGKRFAHIAENPALTNSDHVHYLPSDWNSIYELSRLPAPELTHLIEAGEVRPDMTRTETKAVVKKILKPARAEAAPAVSPVSAKKLAKIIESCNERLAAALDARIDKKNTDVMFLMPIIRTAESLLDTIRKEYAE